MQQSAQPTQPLTYIDVTYYPGVTVYGATPARLEVKGDRLTLTTAEGTPEQPVYNEVFNISFSEVKKVRSLLDEIRITLADKSYRMSVAQYSTPAIAVGGVVGAVAATNMHRRSGAVAFLQTLRERGVPVSYVGYAKGFGIAALIAGVIFAGFVVAAMLYG